MYTKEDSELATFGVGIGVGMGLLAIILVATKSTSVDIKKKAQKEAVAHGAAHYTVDTNGVVSFEWNK
jgi:Zn-dependent alcohol dehydrogenase